MACPDGPLTICISSSELVPTDLCRLRFLRTLLLVFCSFPSVAVFRKFSASSSFDTRSIKSLSSSISIAPLRNHYLTYLAAVQALTELSTTKFFLRWDSDALCLQMGHSALSLRADLMHYLAASGVSTVSENKDHTREQ